MIIDFNSYIGNYPFRRIKYNTPHGLYTLMSKVGIDKALVSGFEAIFYKNWFEANSILLHEIEKSSLDIKRRMLACITVNPLTPGWTFDLDKCIEKAFALRLYPNYHGYRLNEREVDTLAEEARPYNLPILITVRIQDERSHPLMLRVPPVDLSGILEFAERHSDIQFVICNAYFNEVLSRRKEISSLENVHVELSFISTVRLDSIEVLSNEIGADRLILGTYMPFFYPECIVNRIKLSELSRKDKELIMWRNAAKLLKINDF
ncbi:hypothetical protein CW702_02445 [Candidatus Bathyarchaeota archaeon]|nr:MAG: hypothetical protein CW702_02445 [Candidatus Bathyarchaeota archaeon]